MLDVSLHDDVIHVDSGKVTHVLERHAHGSLESAGRVGLPEWHHEPLKRAPLGLEGCLVYVLWGHPHLVETGTEVHLRKILRTIHFVYLDIYPRSWIDIFDSYRVQAAVVDAEV